MAVVASGIEATVSTVFIGKPVTVTHWLSPRRNVVAEGVPVADKSPVRVAAPVCDVVGVKLMKEPLEAVNDVTPPAAPFDAKVILPCWSTVIFAFV